jgi:hypothetical protein
MVYPAHIQWNGFISGHVARPHAATIPGSSAPDDASAVPPPASPVTPRPPAACGSRRRAAGSLRRPLSRGDSVAAR